MNDNEKWEQIYMQKPIMDKDYKFAYDIWYKYFMKCEVYDRLIVSSGRPMTVEQRASMTENCIKVRKKLGINSFLEGKEFKKAKEHALHDVDKFFEE